MSINRTNMLDMDCKEGDCQIRIIADKVIVGKFRTFEINDVLLKIVPVSIIGNNSKSGANISIRK